MAHLGTVSSRWYWWLLASALAVLYGLLMYAFDTGEWGFWTGSIAFFGAVLFAVIGVVLGIVHIVHKRRIAAAPSLTPTPPG